MQDLILLLTLAVLVCALIINAPGQHYSLNSRLRLEIARWNLVPRLRLEIARWNFLHEHYPHRGW